MDRNKTNTNAVVNQSPKTENTNSFSQIRGAKDGSSDTNRSTNYSRLSSSSVKIYKNRQVPLATPPLARICSPSTSTRSTKTITSRPQQQQQIRSSSTPPPGPNPNRPTRFDTTWYKHLDASFTRHRVGSNECSYALAGR